MEKKNTPEEAKHHHPLKESNQNGIMSPGNADGEEFFI